LADATLLAYPQSNLPTSIHADASDKCIGGVLQQQHGDNWKPIAFFLGNLMQLNSATLLLIVNFWLLKSCFSFSLLGRGYEIYTLD